MLSYFKSDAPQEDASFSPRSQSEDQPLKVGAMEKVKMASLKVAKDISKATIKNKRLRTLAKSSQKVLANIHSSDDPIQELGPGVSSYHQLLTVLFCLFLILSIITAPLMNKYYKFGHFYGQGVGLLSQLSLGNVGFSETQCVVSSMLAGNKKELECKTGHISRLVDWGIKTDFEDQMQCAEFEEDVCKPFLDKEAMKKTFE